MQVGPYIAGRPGTQVFTAPLGAKVSDVQFGRHVDPCHDIRKIQEVRLLLWSSCHHKKTNHLFIPNDLIFCGGGDGCNRGHEGKKLVVSGAN